MSLRRGKVLGSLALFALVLGGSACQRQRADSPSVPNPAGQTGDNQSMPGMGSMSMGPAGKASGVPDHAEVTIPGEVQQRIGVTVGQVTKGPLQMSVRTVGIVQANETQVAHIHLKTEGWVDRLFVSYTGQQVKQGAPLLSIYSPQFVTTQQEYLDYLKGDQKLAILARSRLELWDVPAEEIRALEKSGRPRKDLVLRSPINGTVLQKNVFEGQYVTAKDELYVVADLSTVWVQAKVYEYELPHVELGQPAAVALPALPEQKLSGKVVFIQPTVNEKTRTTQVRVELPNPDGALRPGMFANVVIEHTMGEGLLVPASAIIRTGERDIAFKVVSEGRFMPVLVKISPLRFEGDRFQILEGLKVGDQVVTSANFLIDSESRLRLGAGMAGMPGMDMGGMKELSKDQKKP